MKTILNVKPDVVVIAQESGHSLAHMKETADAMRRAGVARTIFVGPAPHWLLRYLPDMVAFDFASADSIPVYTFGGIDKAYIELDNKLSSTFPVRSDASYLSITDSLCNSTGCRVYIGERVIEGLTTWDFAHLTPIASHFVAKAALVPAILASY
jgi:hypothetical protein